MISIQLGAVIAKHLFSLASPVTVACARIVLAGAGGGHPGARGARGHGAGGARGAVDETAGGASPDDRVGAVRGQQRSAETQFLRTAELEQFGDGVQIGAVDVGYRKVRAERRRRERVVVLRRVVGVDEADGGCVHAMFFLQKTLSSHLPGPIIGSFIRPRQAHMVSWLAVSTGLPSAFSSGSITS